MTRLVPAAALFALALPLAACGGDGGDAEANTEAGALRVEDAFVMVPPSGRDVSMGGARITAPDGARTYALEGAALSRADTVELHTVENDNGTMRMRQVPSFGIAPGETLELRRGGNHFMLFGVSPALADDETAELALTFSCAPDCPSETVTVEAEVRPLGG